MIANTGLQLFSQREFIYYSRSCPNSGLSRDGPNFWELSYQNSPLRSTNWSTLGAFWQWVILEEIKYWQLLTVFNAIVGRLFIDNKFQKEIILWLLGILLTVFRPSSRVLRSRASFLFSTRQRICLRLDTCTCPLHRSAALRSRTSVD